MLNKKTLVHILKIELISSHADMLRKSDFSIGQLIIAMKEFQKWVIGKSLDFKNVELW